MCDACTKPLKNLAEASKEYDAVWKEYDAAWKNMSDATIYLNEARKGIRDIWKNCKDNTH